jgi:hypothetical protein
MCSATASYANPLDQGRHGNGASPFIAGVVDTPCHGILPRRLDDGACVIASNHHRIGNGNAACKRFTTGFEVDDNGKACDGIGHAKVITNIFGLSKSLLTDCLGVLTLIPYRKKE